MPTVHHSVCPVCSGTGIRPLLTVKDHSVSGEAYVIWQCENCSLRFTQDAPDASSIVNYYASPDYISHTNTSEGLVNKLYQRIRSFTLMQKKKLIVQVTGKTTGSLLDVGAGAGAFLDAMKKGGWQTTGIEPDETARDVARRTYGLHLQTNDDLDTLQPQSFDAITLWHVLEHVHHLHPFVEKLKTLVKPGGKIIIAVPNYQSLDADVYRLYWAAYDVPRHLYHFTPKAIGVLAGAHGLKITATKPMWFDAFYISLLSSKYRHGKSRWVGAGLAGLRSNLTALTDKTRCSSLIYVMENTQ